MERGWELGTNVPPRGSCTYQWVVCWPFCNSPTSSVRRDKLSRAEMDAEGRGLVLELEVDEAVVSGLPWWGRQASEGLSNATMAGHLT